jgi:hypothetical protein
MGSFLHLNLRQQGKTLQRGINYEGEVCTIIPLLRTGLSGQ